MDTIDAHLIFQKIKRKNGKINVIPKNSERYVSFDVGHLKFLDSMRFLSHDLDELVKQLSNDQFKHLMVAYPENGICYLKRVFTVTTI